MESNSIQCTTNYETKPKFLPYKAASLFGFKPKKVDAKKIFVKK